MGYDEQSIRKSLSSSISHVNLFDEIDSTSSEARRYAVSGGSCPALFLADTQSGGRGRMGRSFFSPKGSGIYMSLLLPAAAELSDTVLMTSAAAVAVRRAILRVTSADTKIKWVNDLYLNGKKVCGILCELLTEEKKMIVGVGINLYGSEFPEDISHIAGAIYHTEADDKVRSALVCAVAEELISIHKELGDGAFMKEYKENSALLGREIRYTDNGVWMIGTAVDIDDRGRLYVRDGQGQTRILSSGEISVRFE